MTQAMRGDLAHRGVRAIAVLPGAMDTDMTRNYDIPKTSPSRVAEEILEAIQTEPREIAVGDDASCYPISLLTQLGLKRLFRRSGLEAEVRNRKSCSAAPLFPARLRIDSEAH